MDMASEPLNSDPNDDAKAETIRVFTNHDSANLAAANLQAHGVHCWINADDAGGMLPNFAAPEGVRLLVRASDAAAALALLTDIPAQDELEDGA